MASEKTKKGFSVNHYRFKKIRDKYLVTTDHGSWVALDEKNFNLLKTEKIKKKSKLFKLLEEKGVILTKTNESKVIEDLRERYSFLFQGASLHIVVPTLRCNMNCIYCHASSKPVNARSYDMDKETAKKVVDFIFQSPSKHITVEFQGGEPLLNFEVVKYIVDYSKRLNKKYKKDLFTCIVTNLTLMNDEKLNYLIKNGVAICTSLDGSKQLHDKNRFYFGGRGSYKNAVKWIKNIQEKYKKRKIKNRRIDALITLTRNSLNYPKEVIDEYVKNRLEEIHLRFLNNLGDARPVWSEINYSADEFIEFWKKSVDYIVSLNKKHKKINERMVAIMLRKILNIKGMDYLDLRSPCGAAIGQLVYNYDGSIYTCDEGRMIGEDIFKLGNVRKDNYKNILGSDQTCGIIAASVNDVFICDNCIYKPYCGLCPVHNYAEQGSIITKIPQTDRCKIFKAQFDYVFNKLLFDKEAKRILLNWVKNE